MSRERREELVEIARSHDLLLIEDDVYSVFVSSDIPTLAELPPERTFHVGSLSKSFAPGLRVGHILAPPDRLDACLSWLQATQSMAHPLSAHRHGHRELRGSHRWRVEIGLRAGSHRKTLQCRSGRTRRYRLAPQEFDGFMSGRRFGN